MMEQATAFTNKGTRKPVDHEVYRNDTVGNGRAHNSDIAAMHESKCSCTS